SKSAAPKEPAAARAPRAAAPPSSSGDYFVQVGAFKNPDTAKKLAVRLRGQKYNVEETSASGAQPARSASTSAPPTSAPASPADFGPGSGGRPVRRARQRRRARGHQRQDLGEGAQHGAVGRRRDRAAEHAAARRGRALEGSRGRWPQGAGPSRPRRLGAGAGR